MGEGAALIGAVTPPDYPTLFFFEVGQWWAYAMLLLVIALLTGAAWLAQRNMWVVLALFVVVPITLTIFWWPHSTAGMARERGRELGQVVATLSLISPRLYLFIADRILANETIAHMTPRDTKAAEPPPAEPARTNAQPKTTLSYSSESIKSRTSCDGVVPRS